MVNYHESKEDMSMKSAALLDSRNDLLLADNATTSQSFRLNVDRATAAAAAASKQECEGKIQEAWSSVYGLVPGDLNVQVDEMGTGGSSMEYTISGNGESCKKAIQTADHSKIEAYLASAGFIKDERETTLNTDSSAHTGHYSSEISFNVPATTSTNSTLQSGSTIIEAEVLPTTEDVNHSESFESGIIFTVPATSSSSAASPSTTTGSAAALEDTVYFRGSISDNYQPLVESLLQNSWNKATNDFSSYNVKVQDKTEHTDRFGEPINGYRYSVKRSGGGSVPELSAEQSQTFTNHITIELYNTNVFKQDEVVLYSGSVRDLKQVRATSSDDVIITSLEPTNAKGSSFKETTTIVSSLEPTHTIVTSLEPNDNNRPSLEETLWVSSRANDGFDVVSQEMKNESGSSLTEHFISSSGHTESKTLESFSTSQVQETSYHREQFSTQVFHIQKDVFAESHGLHVVHNDHDGKEHV